ncbi:MAG: hypothetical protein M1825_006021 [Sarcosagium campestre]|nr:MAG: hypothetical protein M1825_006021 [Sarcosagium campestre]
MKVLSKDRRQRSRTVAPEGRAVNSVSSDVERLLRPKSHEQLVSLEKQIQKKLKSGEPIDVDYWEQLLQSLLVWKARAKLKVVYQSVVDARVKALRDQQREDADSVRGKLQLILSETQAVFREGEERDPQATTTTNPPAPDPIAMRSRRFDPQPLLQLRADDKGLESINERAFLQRVAIERRKVLKLGFVPMRNRAVDKPFTIVEQKAAATQGVLKSSNAEDDFSQATSALYEREVARGINEDEEIFAGEENLTAATKPSWAGKHRPRKPRYFNRVQMGYEWNKYNQTHYDHDNPPPKVVQGYKFNIFYPDLIDRSKAPTYRIERENGRRRGESFAAAGEEDTCLIRFISGPPYEDIAFRIVDKEWDYSAKRERGFKSSFDKGILQLHFQFKKIYYRK